MTSADRSLQDTSEVVNAEPGKPKRARVDTLSITSLYLKLRVNKQHLGTATGFVVQHDGKFFLISNWHVFSGRDAITEEPLHSSCGLPDEVRIAHHIQPGLGVWRFHGESLFDKNGSPRWVEHPKGRLVDVACLRLRNLPDDVVLYPLDLAAAHVDIDLYPAMAVSVIGFPFGLRPNVFFAIWKTGHIASDPDIPYNGQEAFLIDATTREGMSGSPVVARVAGAARSGAGVMVMSGGIRTKFLGVYSNRIHDKSEIGCVWRPVVIRELLERASAA